MPQLTFPIAADGLCLSVRLNLEGEALKPLLEAGEPIPASVEAKGLIDTGTDISAVAATILHQLGIPACDQRETQSIAGPLQVRLFRVTLFLFDATQPQLPWFTLPDLVVMELPSRLPVDVLIGMDVLRSCKMLVDGPAQQFTLEFGEES